MKNLANIFNALRHNVDGVAAVEAAIIMPILSVLGLGVMDSSYMYLQNHKMEQALVAAANYLSLSTAPQSVESQAKQIAVTGSLSPGGAPLIKNWSISDISIQYKMVANNNGAYRGGDFIRVVDITSTHPYSGFGIIKAVTGNNVTLTAQYQQRMTATTQ